MTRTFDQPAIIDAWQHTVTTVADLGAGLSDAQWRLMTACPGWTAGDVVAHTADIESMVGGQPRPDHTPDWAVLPHASGPFGQFTEVGVDLRRSWPPADVVADLRAQIAHRREQLDAVPLGGEVPGLMGDPVPLERLLRMRVFDAWVHEQDIRAAIGEGGDWSTDGAVLAFQQMAAALPYVWGKNVKAPVGASVRVSVTGPDLIADLGAVVGEDRRGVASAPASDGDVHLICSWPDYMRLSCGRIDPGDPALRDRITLVGDPTLAGALLSGMAITP
jgi:uncharacterized protein (TIGR03083 family)